MGDGCVTGVVYREGKDDVDFVGVSCIGELESDVYGKWSKLLWRKHAAEDSLAWSLFGGTISAGFGKLLSPVQLSSFCKGR